MHAFLQRRVGDLGRGQADALIDHLEAGIARPDRDLLGAVPVVVGGIIPPEDAQKLTEAGVARVYTPKDYDLNAIIADIVALIDRGSREAA